MTSYGNDRNIVSVSTETEKMFSGSFDRSARTSKLHYVCNNKLTRTDNAVMSRIWVKTSCLCTTDRLVVVVILNDNMNLQRSVSHELLLVFQCLTGQEPAYLADDCQLTSDIGTR